MRKSAENARNVYGINLISRTVPGTTALYGYNGHGDVINLTSEGTVVAAYYYDEFGNHADIENHAGVFAELLPTKKARNLIIRTATPDMNTLRKLSYTTSMRDIITPKSQDSFLLIRITTLEIEL